MGEHCCGSHQPTLAERLQRYKDLYNDGRGDIYFYVTKSGDIINVVFGAGFNAIFVKDIEPNLEKGSMFIHIKHFNGSIKIEDYAAYKNAR